MLELISKHWAPISGFFSLATLILMALLGKTFAKKETVIQLQKDLDSVKGKVDEMPTKDEWHSLHLEMANLRGDLKALSPQLTQVAKVSDLLLENQINKEKA